VRFGSELGLGLRLRLGLGLGCALTLPLILPLILPLPLTHLAARVCDTFPVSAHRLGCRVETVGHPGHEG